MRIVHRAASVGLVLVVLVAAVLALLGRRAWPLAVWAVAVIVALFVTGRLIAWDQLALRSVTSGTRIDGMAILWDDEVRFVIVDGVEVGPGTIQRWTVTHLAALPIIGMLAPGIAALTWKRSRRTS